MNARVRMHRPLVRLTTVAAAAPLPEAPPNGGHAAARTSRVRRATPADASAIHALIEAHQRDGHLLPRDADEVAAHVTRFHVADFDGHLLGCADLAPLSRSVAEVRSLVVDGRARHGGIGTRLLNALTAAATAAGFSTLCAFTHAPAYFVGRGFSIVPHAWLPEKIQADCGTCAHFRRCGQYAVMLPLAAIRTDCVPLASLHG